jgi:hypothetical protein
MPKVHPCVFQVDFGQDAKNQIAIFAVFQVDFGQDAKNPRAPSASSWQFRCRLKRVVFVSFFISFMMYPRVGLIRCKVGSHP